jgi:hypothetical protein
MNSAVWRFRRVLALSFAALVSLYANSALATGAITANQPVTGTISGSGSDSYTFNVAKGTSFVVSIGATSNQSKFFPQIDIDGPGSFHAQRGGPLQSLIPAPDPTDGQWTLKVSQLNPDSGGGSYSLTLAQTPVGQSATALTLGNASSETNTPGKLDFWTFSGTAGQTMSLSLTPTSGQGFVPDGYIFLPSGALKSGPPCSGECDISIAETGTYTVVVVKGDDNNVTGAYSISINNKN